MPGKFACGKLLIKRKYLQYSNEQMTIELAAQVSQPLEMMLAGCNRNLPAVAVWLYALIFMLGAVPCAPKLSKRFVLVYTGS